METHFSKKMNVENQKLDYLIKTLSRTNRKDYENYVINRIYNLLNDFEIKPVTQKYVRRKKSSSNHKYALIDLYFPQFNIGIEIDESYHLSREEEDKLRFEDIVSEFEHYEQKRIPVAGLSLEKINSKIDEVVSQIQAAKNKQKEKNIFVPWKIISAKEYFKNKNIITTEDDFQFSTIKDVLNELFNCDYDENVKFQRTYFSPKSFNNEKNKNIKFWFPQLAVNDMPAGAHGWKNMTTDNGKTIIESRDKGKQNDIFNPEVKRITFVKIKDKVTNTFSYKFMGIYSYESKEENKGKIKTIYKRIKKECPIFMK